MSSPIPQTAAPSSPAQDPAPLSVPNYDTRSWASRAQWYILEQNIPKYQEHRTRRKTAKLWPVLRGACEAVSSDHSYSEKDRGFSGGRAPIVPTNTQLLNWYRNRNRKRNRREGQKLLTTIMAKAQPARTRAPKLIESYQKLYKAKISVAVNKRLDEMEAAGASKEVRRAKFLEVNNITRDALYETEDDSVKKQVEEHYKKHQADGNVGEKLFSKGGTFGHVVNCVERILIEFLGILHEETGLVFSTAYGGVTTPTSMQTGWVHIGRNADGRTMKEFDKPAVLDFTAKYTQFVRKAIPQNKREQLMGLWDSKAWDLAELGLTCHDIDEPDEDVEEDETSDHQGCQPLDPPRPARKKTKKRTSPIQDQAQKKKAQPPPPIPSLKANLPDLRASNNNIGRSSIEAYLDPALMAPSLTGADASSSRSGPSSPSQLEFDEPPIDHELPTPSLSGPAYPHAPPPADNEPPSPSLSTPHDPRSPPPADNEPPSPSLSALHYPRSPPPADNEPPSPSLSGPAYPRSPPPADNEPPSPSLSDDFASPFLNHSGDITNTHGTVPENHSGSISSNQLLLTRWGGPSEPMPMARETVLTATDVVLDGAKSNSDFAVSLLALRALQDEDNADRWKALCPSFALKAISCWIMDPERRVPPEVNRGDGQEFAAAWRDWWKAVSAFESVDSVTLRWLLVSLAWWRPPDASISGQWCKSCHTVRIYLMRINSPSTSSQLGTALTPSDASFSQPGPPNPSKASRKRAASNRGRRGSAKRARSGRGQGNPPVENEAPALTVEPPSTDSPPYLPAPQADNAENPGDALVDGPRRGTRVRKPSRAKEGWD